MSTTTPATEQHLIQLLRKLIQHYLEVNNFTLQFSAKLRKHLLRLFEDYAGDLAQGISLDDAQLRDAIHSIQKHIKRYFKLKKDKINKHLDSIDTHAENNKAFITILTAHTNKLERETNDIEATYLTPAALAHRLQHYKKLITAEHAVHSALREIKQDSQELLYLLDSIGHELVHSHEYIKFNPDRLQKIFEKEVMNGALTDVDKIEIRDIIHSLLERGLLPTDEVFPLYHHIQKLPRKHLSKNEYHYLHSLSNKLLHHEKQQLVANPRLIIVNNILEHHMAMAHDISETEKAEFSLAAEKIASHRYTMPTFVHHEKLLTFLHKVEHEEQQLKKRLTKIKDEQATFEQELNHVLKHEFQLSYNDLSPTQRHHKPSLFYHPNKLNPYPNDYF